MPEIEVVTAGELIVVHDLTIDYSQRSVEVIKGLLKNHPLIENFDLAEWNRGKSGFGNITLRLHRRREWLSTPDARQFVRSKGDIPCLSTDIIPLGWVEKELWDAGVWCIVALCESDDQLWRDADRLFGVVRYCGIGYHGLRLHYADEGWRGLDWFAGFPKSRRLESSP